MELAYRTGTFLILLGSILVVLFIIADMAKIVEVRLLIGGALLIGAGYFLRKRYAFQERPSSGRFRILRRVFRKKEKK